VTTTEERLAMLDEITAKANDILDKAHHVMHEGKPVIHPETGEPIDDPWPVLNAIDVLIRASELREAIYALDAGKRSEITE
jgi:hypothetical protein